jgi:hypothetical protein
MLKSLWQSLLVSGCLIVMAVPALAQPKKDAGGGGGAGIAGPQEQTEPNYVFPYFLVVLSTGLGLYVLNKPTRRTNVDEKDTALA